jgi:hypothetical protein
MIEARIPLPIIAKIVGWSPGTMAKMAARYGHFGIEELRGAVGAIVRPSLNDKLEAESLDFSLESDSENEIGRAN